MMKALASIVIIAGMFVSALVGVLAGRLAQRKQKLKKQPLQIIFNNRVQSAHIDEPLEIIGVRKAGNLIAAVVLLAFCVSLLFVFAGETDAERWIFAAITLLASLYNLSLTTRNVRLYRNAIGVRRLGREKLHFLADIDRIEVYNVQNAFGKITSFGYRIVVADGKPPIMLSAADYIDTERIEQVYTLSNPNVEEIKRDLYDLTENGTK